MRQLAALSSYLLGLDFVAAETFDSWVENPVIVPAGTDIGNGSIVLFRHQYNAVIVLERFPHKVHSPDLLFGHVCAWLMDHDGDDVRFDGSAASVSTEVDILDDVTADVIFTIDFVEDVTAVEDLAGTIPLAGKLYRLADEDVLYAESGEVIASYAG